MPDPVTGIVAATAGSGLASAFGASSAAGKIGDAATRANQAADMRWQQMTNMFREMFEKGQAALQPFIDTGTTATNQLRESLGGLVAPITMDQETLEKTPGYQWLKTQGMRGVTGQNVLRGLSGAQLKGAADFVKGLADTTYKTQFDVANINKTNAFNRLFQTSESGRGGATALLDKAVSGAVGMSGVGQQNAALQSGNIMTAGQAAGAADMAIGRAIGDTVSSLPYAPYIANRLYPTGSFTGMYQTNVPMNNSGIYTGDPTIPGFGPRR